jgi:hypothetical protein
MKGLDSKNNFQEKMVFPFLKEKVALEQTLLGASYF